MRCSSKVVVVVVVSLLVLSLLLTGAQGIRLKKGLFLYKQLEDELIHEERKSSLTKTNDARVAEAVLCKEAAGDCNTGILNRKLVSTTSTTSTSITDTKNDDKNKAQTTANSPSKSKSSNGKNSEKQTEESRYSSQDDLYVDITDITEMDYSPARRKTPIHN